MDNSKISLIVTLETSVVCKCSIAFFNGRCTWSMVVTCMLHACNTENVPHPSCYMYVT